MDIITAIGKAWAFVLEYPKEIGFMLLFCLIGCLGIGLFLAPFIALLSGDDQKTKAELIKLKKRVSELEVKNETE